MYKIKPFVTTVSDYHEFNNVINYFHDAGIKLKYEEVGCDGMYYAVFYQNKKDANSLIKKIKEQLNRHEQMTNNYPTSNTFIKELIAENEKLKAINSEWLRATRELENAEDNTQINEAIIKLSELRLGNSYAEQPPCALEIAMKNCEELNKKLNSLLNEIK